MKDGLSAFLALNGSLVLVVSMLAGLMLYRSVAKESSAEEDWHLLHAGGTSRGVTLLALAATVNLAALPEINVWWSAVLAIFFVWTSVLVMLLRALTGHAGYGLSGAVMNKTIFLLYAMGTIAVFLGFGLLILGFWRAAVAL